MFEASPIYAWIVQSIEEANQILLSGGKIVIISETIPEYLNSPQYGTSCLMANDLLPNYQAVDAYINGTKEEFLAKYYEMLDSPESTIYFATILAAIVNSIPLGFVFGVEQIEVDSMIGILQYIEMKFGIKLGHLSPLNGESPIATGFINSNYVAPNFVFLYMSNLLTSEEFLSVYPVQYPIPDYAIHKLAFDLKPVIPNPCTMQDYAEYFENIRRLMAKFQKPLIDPLVKG